MSLFGFGKKKEETKGGCCQGANCTSESMQEAEKEKAKDGIKVLKKEDVMRILRDVRG